MKIIRGRLNDDELALITSIIGERISGRTVNYKKIKTFWIIRDTPGFRISNFSLPLKIVGIPENPLSSAHTKSILIHEIFHQTQYRRSIISFIRLIFEQIAYKLLKKDVYEYGRDEFLNREDIIKNIYDIKTLEGQASFAQDFAYNYFLYIDMMNVHDSLDTNKNAKTLLYKSRSAKYARVLRNSGLDSDAISKMA
ncbi:MAG: hypothetical protein MUC95_03405 [Spirochaetes bacterium]|nr:hypothetical protein [Spirochaetota bacterium]